MRVSAEQSFIVKIKSKDSGVEEIFDNGGQGFAPDLGVTYIELGEIPFSIRYADYDKMFKGVLTVIIQYSEQPAEITVSTSDGNISETLVLSGLPNYSDIGLFRLFSK